MPVIIPHVTDDSYFDVYKKYIEPKATLVEDDFPWVNIRHLYLSTYQSGNGSWKPALTDAKSKGAKKVYILTGRHGDQYGGKVDIGGHMDKTEVQSRSHFEEDEALAKKLSSPQCSVVVIDVGTDKNYNSIQGLKTLIDELSRKGYVVCAWCFSLLAMYWYTQQLDPQRLKKQVEEQMSTSISKIVAEKWSWVH